MADEHSRSAAVRVGRCLWRIGVAAAAGCGVGTAPAQQRAASLEPVEVVGVASRTERGIDETPASVSVITREDLERAAAVNVREALRYEPGVTVEAAAGRFGLGDISIRGIGGNRVLYLLDGIRQPDSYRVGRFASASRSQFDLSLLGRIEILRGPGSALYGSDALGGVVSLSTVEPADILGATASAGAEVGGSYASASARIGGLAVLAGERGPLQGLLGVQYGDGGETGNQGTVDVVGRGRTTPDPQRARNGSLLGKLVHDGRVRWRLTLERSTQDIETDVLSLNPLSARTVRLSGDDSVERSRASLDAEALDIGGFRRLRALAYAQRSLTINDTVDVRADTTMACLSAPGPIDCRRDVRFRFEQKESGLTLLAEARGWGYWLFGVEAARVRYDESRDGSQTILDTGQVGSVVGGEPMPTRDFPLTTSDRIGAFVQNEARLAGGRLDLVAALRFDGFRNDAHADAVFAAAHPGRPVVDSQDTALSPKLGALYRLTPTTTLTAQFAAGFRAPPAADLNLGLSSLPAGYAVAPNPDLQPERSRGVEAGVRERRQRFEFTASAFLTDYDQLIVSRAPLRCPGEPACVPGAPATFQSQNIAGARIWGVEAAAAYRLDGPWSVRASASGSWGEDRERGRPLNTVDPPRAVAGLLYDSADANAALHVTHVWRQDRVDRSAGEIFVPPSCTVVDLTASWRIAAALRLSAGVFNLFDSTCWQWSDVRNLIAPGATIERYTLPGRNASVLLRVRF
jgi:hemoglobin/transferrin/lactoferrin receptor protein